MIVLILYIILGLFFLTPFVIVFQFTYIGFLTILGFFLEVIGCPTKGLEEHIEWFDNLGKK